VREIKDVYDSIDVFISPSRSEAFAYAVAETAYCQCQVIASDVPGQNTMKDIPGILWVESDNVQSLVDAILQSVERKNNGEAEKIKVGQRKYVREHYGVDLWVQKNLDVYKKYFS
jgi:glycosyltransferase involved in cell wall biosynthesis